MKSYPFVFTVRAEIDFLETTKYSLWAKWNVSSSESDLVKEFMGKALSCNVEGGVICFKTAKEIADMVTQFKACYEEQLTRIKQENQIAEALTKAFN